MRKSGFDVFEGLVDARTLRLLRAEAVVSAHSAPQVCVAESDEEEVRGGAPARRYRSGPGGPILDAYYSGTWMLDFLRSITGPSLLPTGALGTFSYYLRAGDFLAIHRDVVDCDVAVITALHQEGGESDGTGRLCLYPSRIFEPLSAVRTTPKAGAVEVPLKVGQTVVMYGGIVPHALLPLSEGQRRVVSVLCYRLQDRTTSVEG